MTQVLQTESHLYRTATQEMIHVVQDCPAAGVPMAGLLLDGEFGRDAGVTFSHGQQIPVLIRAK